MLVPISSCIDPFEPDVKGAPESLLVVSGFINSTGVSTIKLSRTQNLAQDNNPPSESGASVFIEEEAGARYALVEVVPGNYSSGNLMISASKRCRLYLKTKDSKVYASDYVAVRTTPAIDNVAWKADATGVRIFVNSHDANDQTHYYRWNYEETWQYTSAYNSSYKYDNGQIVERNEDIYHCWVTEKSTLIQLGNTTRLNQDVVADYPLTSLSPTSVKLRYKYSILVRQYAQTQEEYKYWENLKKNTESIGTIFDPLPSQLTGNVHNLGNSAEPVIGFVGAYSVSEKRIFIENSELPKTWRMSTGYESCLPLDTIKVSEVKNYFNTPNYLPVYPISNMMGQIIGYTGASTDCVDCRRRGTNVKPDFWR
ncbi:DUF4249 domain-containing protein [Hymenobacter jejuensis]|uniref:DUF4249 domain-containing protein n=1 Tax=Hymenobacter jejuensis TaxID=2502781 RepID=UPI0013FCFD0F|nr:DUF4249 domain-containing protein [Hymenobacter jejuensis]